MPGEAEWITPGGAYVSYDDPEHYVWLVVLGAFASFSAAFGIGANDVANAFATSVGSKALTVKQACAIAVVMEFVGATFLGGEVVKTIRKGIADEDAFLDNPPLLMYGCLCVITAVAAWLIIACKLEMPVSTTHSCVGGMIGMAIAARGANAVVWYKDPDPANDKPLPGGFIGVVISWFVSPILSGTLAFCLFFVVRLVLRSKNPFRNSVRIYPVLVMGCVTIITLFMLMKGIKSVQAVEDMSIGLKVGISFACGAGVAILSIPGYIYCKRRIEQGDFKAPPLAIEVAEERLAALEKEAMEKGVSTTKLEQIKLDEKKLDKDKEAESKTIGERIKASMMSSLNADIYDAVELDESVLKLHRDAERFDKDAEAMFTYLQVFSACFDALAHGANDVANAVGPFATIFMLYNGGVLGSKQDMNDNKYWILGMGGVGIGVGLLLYGSHILRAIGVKLAVITPSRGFCIEMGSSVIVIIGAYFGLPLSTTHCQVGATVGVSLLEGFNGFNRMVFAKTAFGWVITCVIVGLLAGFMTAAGAGAPVSRYAPVYFFNATTGFVAP